MKHRYAPLLLIYGLKQPSLAEVLTGLDVSSSQLSSFSEMDPNDPTGA